MPASLMADLAAKLNRDPAYRFESCNAALAGDAAAPQSAAERLFEELFFVAPRIEATFEDNMRAFQFLAHDCII